MYTYIYVYINPYMSHSNQWLCMWVRVCVWVRVWESTCVCVCVFEWVRVRDRERARTLTRTNTHKHARTHTHHAQTRTNTHEHTHTTHRPKYPWGGRPVAVLCYRKLFFTWEIILDISTLEEAFVAVDVANDLDGRVVKGVLFDQRPVVREHILL